MQVQLLTAEQAVERLHEAGMTDLTAKFVKNQMDKAQIPFTKVGNVRRIRSDVLQSVIDGWMEEAL